MCQLCAGASRTRAITALPTRMSCSALMRPPEAADFIGAATCSHRFHLSSLNDGETGTRSCRPGSRPEAAADPLRWRSSCQSTRRRTQKTLLTANLILVSAATGAQEWNSRLIAMTAVEMVGSGIPLLKGRLARYSKFAGELKRSCLRLVHP